MMISWWSKHVRVILSVLMCNIWINVSLQTSALVGPLYLVYGELKCTVKQWNLHELFRHICFHFSLCLGTLFGFFFFISCVTVLYVTLFCFTYILNFVCDICLVDGLALWCLLTALIGECVGVVVKALRYQQVAGSIPDGVIGIFQWHNPSGRTMALGSTRP
jgi:hypothetical protein